MTEPAWFAEARRLVNDEGLSRRDAAGRLGKSLGTIGKAFMDPEKYAASYRNDLARKAPCERCGKPHRFRPGDGNRYCMPCAKEIAFAPRHERAVRMERLWAEGKLVREIGETLGWTANCVCSEITELRRLGYSFPHRDGPGSVPLEEYERTASLYRELGSHRAVAEALGITAAAVGQRLRRLERRRAELQVAA